MKLGDLVKHRVRPQYPGPNNLGLIIGHGTSSAAIHVKSAGEMRSFKIMWNNQLITTEWESYLEVINESR